MAFQGVRGATAAFCMTLPGGRPQLLTCDGDAVEYGRTAPPGRANSPGAPALLRDWAYPLRRDHRHVAADAPLVPLRPCHVRPPPAAVVGQSPSALLGRPPLAVVLDEHLAGRVEPAFVHKADHCVYDR